MRLNKKLYLVAIALVLNQSSLHAKELDWSIGCEYSYNWIKSIRGWKDLLPSNPQSTKLYLQKNFINGIKLEVGQESSVKRFRAPSSNLETNYNWISWDFDIYYGLKLFDYQLGTSIHSGELLMGVGAKSIQIKSLIVDSSADNIQQFSPNSLIGKISLGLQIPLRDRLSLRLLYRFTNFRDAKFMPYSADRVNSKIFSNANSISFGLIYKL